MTKLLILLISFFITFVLIVGLHELGHALAARYFGIQIKRISLGYGKILWSYKSTSGYQWCWARWPLGGYVELLNTRIHPVEQAQLPFAFDKKPPWQRSVVLIAGSLLNFIAAWICFVWFYWLGHHYPLAVVKSVIPQSVAAKAAFQDHDQIISINQHPVASWEEANVTLIHFIDSPILHIDVKTPLGHVEQREINLTHFQFSPMTHSLWEGLGIKPSAKFTAQLKAQPIWTAIHSAFTRLLHYMQLFIDIIRQLTLGRLPLSLLVGPFSLLALGTAAFLQGFSVFAYFIGTLSLAVGMINLFPLPGLDGCALLYTGIEKIRGKPLSIAYEILFYQLTMIAFAVLLVQLMLNDLGRLFY